MKYLVVVVACLALSTVSCGDDDEASSTQVTSTDGGASSPTASSTATLTGSPTTSPATKSPSPNPSPEHVSAIGERVSVEDYPDIVVDSFIRSADASVIPQDWGIISLSDGEEVWIIQIRVINDSDKPAGVDSTYGFALLSRGENINAGVQAWAIYAGGLEADVLPAGGEAAGALVFSASAGFDQLQLEYLAGAEPFDFTNQAPGGRYRIGLE